MAKRKKSKSKVESKTTAFIVRMPSGMHKRTKVLCARNQESMNKFIVRLVGDGLREMANWRK